MQNVTVDAGAMSAEEFDKEKKRLLSQREARERESLIVEDHTRKRGLEEDVDGTSGKRIANGGR